MNQPLVDYSYTLLIPQFSHLHILTRGFPTAIDNFGTHFLLSFAHFAFSTSPLGLLYTPPCCY